MKFLFLLSLVLVFCLWIDHVASKSVVESNEGQCDFCEYFVEIIFTGTVAKIHYGRIIRTLAEFCNANTAMYPQQCSDIVKDSPSVIDDIEIGGSIKQQCTSRFNMCHGKSNSLSIPHNQGQCEYCRYVLFPPFYQTIQNVVRNATIEMLHYVCNSDSVIDMYSPACHKIMSNLPLIIQEFKSGSGIDKQCAKLSLCETPSKTPLLEDDMNGAASQEARCDFCRNGVVPVFVSILQGASDNAIIQYASGYCKNVIPLYSQDCNTVVSNLPNIIQGIKDGSGIRQECSKLGICEASATFDSIDLLEQSYARKINLPGF